MNESVCVLLGCEVVVEERGREEERRLTERSVIAY